MPMGARRGSGLGRASGAWARLRDWSPGAVEWLRPRGLADLDELAADAAPHYLDHVAGDRRARDATFRRERGGARSDLRLRVAHEVTQGRRVGSLPELVEQCPAPTLELVQETARRLEILDPTLSLARAQLTGERLGVGARRREPAPLFLGLRTPRLEPQARFLQPGHGARQVTALSRQQPLRGLER